MEDNKNELQSTKNNELLLKHSKGPPPRFPEIKIRFR